MGLCIGVCGGEVNTGDLHSVDYRSSFPLRTILEVYDGITRRRTAMAPGPL